MRWDLLLEIGECMKRIQHHVPPTAIPQELVGGDVVQSIMLKSRFDIHHSDFTGRVRNEGKLIRGINF